MTIKCIDTCLF